MNTIKRWSMERDAAYIHAILSCLRRHGPLVGAADVLQQSVSYLRARHPQGRELEDAVHHRGYHTKFSNTAETAPSHSLRQLIFRTNLSELLPLTNFLDMLYSTLGSRKILCSILVQALL